MYKEDFKISISIETFIIATLKKIACNIIIISIIEIKHTKQKLS